MEHATKLSMIIEDYFCKNQRLKETTRIRRQFLWRELILVTGDMDISDFGYNDAEDFQESLFNKGLEPSSVNSYIKSIRPIFNWAWRRGYSSGDPFAGLKMAKVTKTEIRVYSEIELSEILNAAPDDIWRCRILTAASAGLRRGEILNLTVGDIDFAGGFIVVKPKRETAFTWRWQSKNYECRRVPLCDNLGRLLTRIMLKLPEGQPYLMLSEKRYWWLQQLRQKEQMPERIRICPDENPKPFRAIMSRLNLKGTFHDLRRTCITRWSWELPPQEVQKLAGHADLKTTLEYYLGIRADVLDRAKKINNTFGATGLEPATS